MSELLITSSLDPISEGQTFTRSLPRHITIWQYFDLPDFCRNEFIAEVGRSLEGFDPLGIEGADYAEFGPNRDVPVRRVKSLGRGATLLTLHSVLGAIIERYEGSIENPEWAYEGYNPHVTYVEGRALEEGEQALLQTVELIEKRSLVKEKVVRKVWNLEEA